jgi:hypothetical protein
MLDTSRMTQIMATSTRRLSADPKRRRQQMDLLALVQAFLTCHRGDGHSEQTVRHYGDSLRPCSRRLKESGIEAMADKLTAAIMNTFAA